MHASRICGWLWLTLSLALAAHGEVQVTKDAPTPNRIRPTLLILSGAWSGQIPPTGRVNAPEFLSSVYPGQKIALALLARGTGSRSPF